MSQQGFGGGSAFPTRQEVRRIIGQEIQGFREDSIVAIDGSLGSSNS